MGTKAKESIHHSAHAKAELSEAESRGGVKSCDASGFFCCYYYTTTSTTTTTTTTPFIQKLCVYIKSAKGWVLSRLDWCIYIYTSRLYPKRRWVVNAVHMCFFFCRGDVGVSYVRIFWGSNELREIKPRREAALGGGWFRRAKRSVTRILWSGDCLTS